MENNFQANLHWAQSELLKIKDPEFLKKVTDLLKERPSASNESSDSWVKERLTKAALASEEDIKSGRVYTIEEAKEYLADRRKSWK